METLCMIGAGFVLDLLIGDPHWLYHPVRLIGLGISGGEKLLRALFPKTKTGELIGGAGLFIAMMMGVLNSSPVLYFILIFILLMGAGLTFVPGSMMGVECMDYAMVKVGREMHGIFNSVSSIISKAQAALSSALVGAVSSFAAYAALDSPETFSSSGVSVSISDGVAFCGASVPLPPSREIEASAE